MLNALVFVIRLCCRALLVVFISTAFAIAQSLPAGLVSDESLLSLPAVLGVDSLGDANAFPLDILGSDSGQDILLLGVPSELSVGGSSDSLEALLNASQQQDSVIEFLQGSDSNGADLTPQVLIIDLRDGNQNDPVRDTETQTGNSCSDSDKDGTCDKQDACPNTPPGSPVVPSGCHLDPAKPLQLVGVNFADQSALLTASSGSVLKRAAELLKRQANLQVEIVVHIANPQEREIGLQRAAAVRAFLIAEGVQRDRLALGVSLAEHRVKAPGVIANKASKEVTKTDSAQSAVVELRAVKEPTS